MSTLVALAVVIVAIVGYVVGVAARSGGGHAQSTTARTATQRPAFASSVLFESSSGWKPAAAGPQIPGLPISHAFTFGPGGEANHAGLITGQLAGGEPSPLPARFVAELRSLPDTQVVTLSQTEAYRYAHLRIGGFGPSLTLYAIPDPGGNPTVLACYTTAGYAADMRTCEQIVTTLRTVGQTGSNDLAPDPTFAAQVSSTIAALDRQRVRMRSEMGAETSPATVDRLATSLSAQFAAAAASLAQLEPSPPVGQAQAALARALQRGHEAYAALAAAAGAGNLGAYESARTQVYEAEADVSAALENFALLGYSHA